MDQKLAEAIENSYLCKFCNMTFIEEYDLVGHYVTFHSDEDALDYLGYDPRLEHDTDSMYPSVIPTPAEYLSGEE